MSNFPLLSKAEFDQACEDLCRMFRQHSDLDDWLSMDFKRQNYLDYLRIVKSLSVSAPHGYKDNLGSDEDELVEDDEVWQRDCIGERYTNMPTGNSSAISGPSSHGGV